MTTLDRNRISYRIDGVLETHDQDGTVVLQVHAAEVTVASTLPPSSTEDGISGADAYRLKITGLSIRLSVLGGFAIALALALLGALGGRAYGRWSAVPDVSDYAVFGLLAGVALGLPVSMLTFKIVRRGTPTRGLGKKATMLRLLLILLSAGFVFLVVFEFFNANRWRYNPKQAMVQSSTGMMSDFAQHCSSLGKEKDDLEVTLARTALVKIFTAAAYLYPDQGWYMPYSAEPNICQRWAEALGNEIARSLTPAEKAALKSLGIQIRRTEWSSLRSINDHSVLEIQFGSDTNPDRKRWYFDNGWRGQYVGGAYDEARHLSKYYQRTISWSLH